MCEQKPLTLGSLFDGSGGFPLGGLLAGIQPKWASEVEPFCIRVTTKRLPFVKHYGDIHEMNGGEIEPVDIITFGSPCQDYPEKLVMLRLWMKFRDILTLETIFSE